MIRVGGATEVEVKERKERVDDAMYAIRAAVEEGILPGGGVTTLLPSSRFSATLGRARQGLIDLRIAVANKKGKNGCMRRGSMQSVLAFSLNSRFPFEIRLG
jgi:hypothetical protein